ncbi:hypothetical protein GYA28_02725 [Candidatus Roizmanbacteria bacterium]|jgi:hypothetical protein|nr:hypothetical protein [Candidatus Roizmanbacteria bacterium]
MSNNIPIALIFFLVQVLLIFFVSRLTINNIFYFLRRFTKNEKLIFSLVSLFFLPGTLLHEIAHFFGAMVMMLKVHQVTVFPTWHDDYIKLGSVVYEKKDFLRGVIVGIFPFVFGTGFFWLVAKFKLFPQPNLLLNVLWIYLFFNISSTMFSSKQDLIDIVYILPVLVIVAGFVYIFNIDVVGILNSPKIRDNLLDFTREVNYYLTMSLGINLGLLVIFKSFSLLFNKHGK